MINATIAKLALQALLGRRRFYLLLAFPVLLIGLVNMMRGGNASTSQTLMRWRVGLQFAAIVVIMGMQPPPI